MASYLSGSSYLATQGQTWVLTLPLQRAVLPHPRSTSLTGGLTSQPPNSGYLKKTEDK